MTLVQKFVQWFREFTGTGPTLRDMVGNMRQGLELQADSASFAMARADEKFEQLGAETENNEALRRQTEIFLRDGNEEMAQRVAAMLVQSNERVERLKTEYQQLQAAAEQKVVSFREREHTVREREAALPELEAEQRMVRMDEQIQSAMSKFDARSSERQFDQAERELRIRSRQLTNKQLITSDPNAELDRQIRQAVGQKKIDDTLAVLRRKVAESGDVVEGEIVSSDPVAEAKRLLEAPRYQGLISGRGSTRDRERVPASRRLGN